MRFFENEAKVLWRSTSAGRPVRLVLMFKRSSMPHIALAGLFPQLSAHAVFASNLGRQRSRIHC